MDADKQDCIPSTFIELDKANRRITVYLDSCESFYGEWIRGEASDIALLRSQETGKVVGVTLPLIHPDIIVHEVQDDRSAGDCSSCHCSDHACPVRGSNDMLAAYQAVGDENGVSAPAAQAGPNGSGEKAV